MYPSLPLSKMFPTATKTLDKIRITVLSASVPVLLESNIQKNLVWGQFKFFFEFSHSKGHYFVKLWLGTNFDKSLTLFHYHLPCCLKATRPVLLKSNFMFRLVVDILKDKFWWGFFYHTKQRYWNVDSNAKRTLLWGLIRNTRETMLLLSNSDNFGQFPLKRQLPGDGCIMNHVKHYQIIIYTSSSLYFWKQYIIMYYNTQITVPWSSVAFEQRGALMG